MNAEEFAQQVADDLEDAPLATSIPVWLPIILEIVFRVIEGCRDEESFARAVKKRPRLAKFWLRYMHVRPALREHRDKNLTKGSREVSDAILKRADELDEDQLAQGFAAARNPEW